MKILVTGVSGQLGYDVVREGKLRGYEMIGSDVVGDVQCKLDITNRDLVMETVLDLRPHVIIHCGAFTAVDKAEEMKEVCWNVNVTGSTKLAIASKEVGAKLVYISTDYVFDGQGEIPYETDQIKSPLNY